MTRCVVAGIDGSHESLVAAEWAAREAALRGLGLRLVHAAPPAPDRDRARAPAAFSWARSGKDLLDRAEARLAVLHPHVAITGARVAGPAGAGLVAACADAALLVVGARGEGGFDGLVVGATALAAASGASCPVVMVPAQAPVPEPEVVVGVGARRAAGPAVDFAFGAARLRGAAVRAVHAWTPPGVSPQVVLGVPEEDRGTWEDEEAQRLSDALRMWRETYPHVAVRPDVVLLHPAYALVRASRRADLLVLGRGPGPRPHTPRLGPVAHAVLHHAYCPVAVVPGAWA